MCESVRQKLGHTNVVTGWSTFKTMGVYQIIEWLKVLHFLRIFPLSTVPFKSNYCSKYSGINVTLLVHLMASPWSIKVLEFSKEVCKTKKKLSKCPLIVHQKNKTFTKVIKADCFLSDPRKWGRAFRVPVPSQKVKITDHIFRCVNINWNCLRKITINIESHGFLTVFSSCSLFSLNLIVLYRRMKKEKEERDLANGINFQYTSPFMSDTASLLKA